MLGVEKNLKRQEKINYIVLLNVKEQNRGKDKRIKTIITNLKYVLSVKKNLKLKNTHTVEDIVMNAFLSLQQMVQKREN